MITKAGAVPGPAKRVVNNLINQKNHLAVTITARLSLPEFKREILACQVFTA